jgi:DNA topoisomerase-6 subunit A
MAHRIPRPIVELLGGFLRRHAALPDAVLSARLEDLANGRAREVVDVRPFAVPDGGAVPAPAGAVVASDPRPTEVRARLAALTAHVAELVRAGAVPAIELPDIHRANAIFDERGRVFLGSKVRRLAFDRVGCKDFVRLLLALETADANVRDDATTTKRGLFYAHRAALPEDDSQVDTDRALGSLANVLRVRRRSLGFAAARRGTLHGRLVIRSGDAVIDVARAGSGPMPRFADDIEIVASDATRIVIVEKDTIGQRLLQAGWCERARCIMVCGGGFPSTVTRELVVKLVATLAVPAVVVADADPGGIRLALTYAHGATSTALETPWLACPDVRWAGFLPSDFERECRKSDYIRLSDVDGEDARNMLAHPSRAYLNDQVRAELERLLSVGAKVECDALVNDPSRLMDYVERKLDEGSTIAL